MILGCSWVLFIQRLFVVALQCLVLSLHSFLGSMLLLRSRVTAVSVTGLMFSNTTLFLSLYRNFHGLITLGFYVWEFQTAGAYL
jgi:hypothetical protein